MPDTLFSVQDQVVLVSGGTRGIGRAIAAGFAARGAQVIVTGREGPASAAAAAELAADGGRVHGEACDVSRRDEIAGLVERVDARFGRIDTLVNVAGVNRRKPAETLTEDDYDYILDINLKGAFLLSQAVGQGMLQRGTGNQINITSLNNDRPLSWVLPYAVSKAGLGQMTKALALEWGPRGVRVNAIAPGFILTDLTRKLWSNPGMLDWGRFNTPQGRMGTPEDLVGAAIFLASPAAAFVTGQILYVDGGFCCGTHWPIECAQQ